MEARRRGVWALVAGAWLAPVAIVCANEPRAAEAWASETPSSSARSFGANSGRFFLIAEPGAEGARLARLAENAWEVWRGPLGLPSRWTSAVTVRLTPPGQWSFPEPARRVVAEPTGVVSVWIRGDDPGADGETDRERRWLTALVEGALRRQAVHLGVAPERAAAPGWLTEAAAEAVLFRLNPALLDEWRRAARRAGVLPPLREVLLGPEGPAASRAEAERRRLAACGAWLWLQAEAGRGPSWARLITGLLEGVPPGLALVRAYTPRFDGVEARELELAWQVGVAAQAALRAVPVWSAEESRRRLEQISRLVARPVDGGAERVLDLAVLWPERGDPLVADARKARLAWLSANVARVHPFYRNAAVSLGAAWLAQGRGDAAAWETGLKEWRLDLEQGRELERASTELLDAVAR